MLLLDYLTKFVGSEEILANSQLDFNAFYEKREK